MRGDLNSYVMLCSLFNNILSFFYLSYSVKTLIFFLLEIRSPWTLHRLCFSWWQRRACPVCPLAWVRSTPATVILTAFSTSPTPHKRCLGHLNQQPGYPADPEADKMNWNSVNTGPDDLLNWTEPSLVQSAYLMNFLGLYKQCKSLNPSFFMAKTL